jgi:transposase-like protein
MRDDWDDSIALVAAGANCPVPFCGALTLAYRPKTISGETPQQWEFKCPHCGTEFTPSDDQLLFQSVQEEWLRTGIHSA